MTNAQRLASATNWGRVVWDGVGVTATVPDVLSLGSPGVEVNSPASIAGVYQFGTASFGPAIDHPNVSAGIVAAVDAADADGPSTTDGCSALANAAAIAGQTALVERGTCGFAVKARNASAAGVAAVIIYNQAANATAAPPGMAGDGINDAFVTAPTVSLSRASGLAIVGALAGGVTADIGVDLSIRAGADALNRARVYAPFPVVGGSSISHYDTVASRNLLMEPAINPDLTHNVKAPFDLTWELLHDVGWTFPDADGDTFPDDEDCNPNSDVRPTIIINGIDTGVPNRGLGAGCTMADTIASTHAASGNHGSFISAIALLTNQWYAAGLITGAQKGAIESAAAKWQ
jgi:PA domain